MLYSAYSQKISSPARSRKEPSSYLNIMAVGQTGTGKTAFVRTLCERLKHNIIQGTLKESKPMVLKGALRPTDDLYTVSMHVEENGERTSLTVIDTPGFDQSIGIEQQLGYISTYIDHQFERTLIEETKLRRDAKAVDTHIHACLYFLDTTSKTYLSDVDRYMLRVLSSRVNVIPVIGKADTLTGVQRETIQKAYRWNFFDTFHIPVYGYIEVDQDDEPEYERQESENGEEEQEGNEDGSGKESAEKGENDNHTGSETMDRIMLMLKEYVEEDNDEDARAMYEYLEHFPLTLIGYEEDPETGRPAAITRDPLKQKRRDADDDELSSPKPDHSTNSQQPSRKSCRSNNTILGRRYPWAVVECCNPNHCDFERLKAMLVSTHRDMLRIDTFERFYEKYRTKKLMNRQIKSGKSTSKMTSAPQSDTRIRA